MKALHRLIVHSATYQQSSRVTPELHERDPFNRLLARGPRFRVEGELVRDIALAASGQLTRASAARASFRRLPRACWPPSYGPMTWNAETGPDRYRRASTPSAAARCLIRRCKTSTFPTATSRASAARVRTPRCKRSPRSTKSIFMECARALAVATLEAGGGPDGRARHLRLPPLRQPAADRGRVPVVARAVGRRSGRIADGWIEPAKSPLASRLAR